MTVGAGAAVLARESAAVAGKAFVPPARDAGLRAANSVQLCGVKLDRDALALIGLAVKEDKDGPYLVVTNRKPLWYLIRSRKLDEETELLLARILFRWIHRDRITPLTNREFYAWYMDAIGEPE